MTEHNIYKDIAARCNGEIYIGVVGPVRTGKSTFIKRFMETLVLPNITNEYDRARARDELPQSAAGKTVMTTEPKFIPDEAVEITLDTSAKLRVKMVDCVGYLVDGAIGTEEEGAPRMVHTPWREETMPFAEAAEYGTKKVICDHAGIGLLLTTDGSFGELSRADYETAEARVVAELKATKKPFAIVLNSATPDAEDTIALAYTLEETYGVPVALVNCLTIDTADICAILEQVLFEFPVTEIAVDLPRWVLSLRPENPLRESIVGTVCEIAKNIKKVAHIKPTFATMKDSEWVTDVAVTRVELGTGKANIQISLDDALYYRTLKEETGFDVDSPEAMFPLLTELSLIKKNYLRVAKALRDVSETGYGVVMPELSDLQLDEPELIRRQGGYGVRLKARANSIHMIRAKMETEINPIVGSEQQSEDLVQYLSGELHAEPSDIWQTNLFGKTLYELVGDGLENKLSNIPSEARAKLSETLERILNEGSSGLICILL